MNPLTDMHQGEIASRDTSLFFSNTKIFEIDRSTDRAKSSLFIFYIKFMSVDAVSFSCINC